MNQTNQEDINYIPVYRAPKETIGEIVRGLLESEGISVMVRSVQVPWTDGVMVMGEGYWGDLLIPEDQADHAREIIQVYEKKG